MDDAIGGLGGGGLSTPYLSNAANAAGYVRRPVLSLSLQYLQLSDPQFILSNIHRRRPPWLPSSVDPSSYVDVVLISAGLSLLTPLPPSSTARSESDWYPKCLHPRRWVLSAWSCCAAVTDRTYPSSAVCFWLPGSGYLIVSLIEPYVCSPLTCLTADPNVIIGWLRISSTGRLARRSGCLSAKSSRDSVRTCRLKEQC